MQKGIIFLGGLIGVGLVAVIGLTGTNIEAADITFIGRGVVKPGGGTNSINVYWTHVPASVEKIAGVRSDVSTSNAKKYKWTETSGVLTKKATASLPVPEREVVIKGVLKSDDRVTASWVVQNYREFKIEGTLQGRTLDSGSTDEGWTTVNVTSSVMRDVVPTRKFKETALKSNDLRVRVNGQTAVWALGNSKVLDEVTASQQKVRIEGEMLDEDTWVASVFTEL